MSLRFILADVFTETPLGGNQLAVFPDAQDIPERHLQPLGRVLNFSETCYLYPSTHPESVGRLRIFTPDAEIPVAGHPVVGMSFVLEAEGRLESAVEDIIVELEEGPVTVHLQRDAEGRLRNAVMTQQPPIFLGQYHRQDCVADALGLRPQELAITGLPCEVVSTGLPFHIVPVGSLDAIRRIRLNANRLSEIQDTLGFGDLFVFTFETVDPHATVHCRMFAPSFGIPEDPATGSASGALGAYLVKHRAVQVRPLTKIQTEQGLEISRPGRVMVEVESAAGTIHTVRVGGSAVVVGEGRIHEAALTQR